MVLAMYKPAVKNHLVSQTANNEAFYFEIAAGLNQSTYLSRLLLFTTTGVGCAVRTMPHPASFPIILFSENCGKHICGVCFVINVLKH
jgi:hypothetical protein